ncbi:hypothetical protein K469DRAFT_698822 [Zopfia rhizophila CBS 207.26]|uniref:SigF-like NTF2-like domain-containing protein n=1 Tax=Zopfia rhizophila CBS 207.26 TaxID=1314779 RepID=A0A6A6EW83_9PEZI|nr:hypothetical protein K469DRAFT_698822 [Zopfia rhizophila CBS 207.26]
MRLINQLPLNLRSLLYPHLYLSSRADFHFSRWYKILSPKIDITVHSVAFDEPNLLLYVNISQVFRIWIIPFYRAPVSLVTVLKLSHSKDDCKYYIESQNDLYQVDQFIKFVAPGGWVLVWLWQFAATLLCVLGAAVLWPVSWVEESMGREGEIGTGKKQKGLVDGIELMDAERKGLVER